MKIKIKRDFVFTVSGDAKVRFHNYPDARIDEVYMELDRNCDAGKSFERNLVTRVEVDKNNNDCFGADGAIYSIENNFGGIMHVQCLGDMIYIGTGIRKS